MSARPAPMSLKISRSIFRVCACCSCVRPSLWTRSFRSARYLRHRSAGFHFHDSDATVEIAATNDFRASSGARQKQPARGSHLRPMSCAIRGPDTKIVFCARTTDSITAGCAGVISKSDSFQGGDDAF